MEITTVMVSPLQLTLVILGPASLLCSIAFLAFIIKVVLQTRHEDDGVDTSAEKHYASESLTYSVARNFENLATLKTLCKRPNAAE
ncbi:hypothetical protein MAR_013258 [Mya arenaria]|uniref:Uncharacterized protein n=1 Tax=Mya arenaria TaxID=6604 RepID=A0ABY7G210_MYAAR|nr:hypothetical protein MAR_013258 [Mya arenaria]